MTDKETMEQQNNQPGDPAAGAEKTQGKAFDPETADKEQWLAHIAEKDETIKSLEDRILRLAAEAENTRKRLDRERKESVTYANEKIIRELLPVLDNLEAALEHGNREEAPQGLVEGVKMTLKTFLETLDRFGCKPFDSVGQPFDPNYHEAMMQEPSAEQPDNTVLREYRKGYVLNDRLLRPAMVVVAKAPGGKPESESSESGASPDKGGRFQAKA